MTENGLKSSVPGQSVLSSFLGTSSMPDERWDKDDRMQVCSICGRSLPRGQLVRNEIVRPALVEPIQRDHPQWSAPGLVCHADLNRYRAEYARRVVDSEEGRR